MADPLSIAASVVGLASVGFTIVKCLCGVADDIGSAGYQVRAYASEINVFLGLLESIRYPLLEIENVPSHGTMMLKDIVDGCDDMLTRLRALTESLTPLLIRFKDSKNKLRQFGIRLEWLLSKKEKLLFYRSVLHQLQLSLTIAICVIKLQNSKDQSDPSTRFVQHSLESSLLVQKLSKFGHSPTQMPLSTNEALDSSPPNPESEELQQNLPALMDSTRVTNGDEVNDSGEIQIESRALVLHSTRETHSTDDGPHEWGQLSSADATENTASEENLTPEDLAEIDEQVENSMEPATLPPTQEIRDDIDVLTRRINQFARKLLSSMRPLIEAASGDNGGYVSPSNNPSASAHSFTPPHSFPIQNSTNGQSQSVNLESTSSFLQTPRPAEPAAPNADIWVQVVDSFGNIHSCAYEDCSTWKGICDFVGSIKPNFYRLFPEERPLYGIINSYNYLVERRAFHFVGPENNIIGSTTWSRIVRPGWTVRLEFSEDDTFNKNPELTKSHAEKAQAFENAKAEENKARAEIQKRKFKGLGRGTRFLAVFNSDFLDWGTFSRRP